MELTLLKRLTGGGLNDFGKVTYFSDTLIVDPFTPLDETITAPTGQIVVLTSLGLSGQLQRNINIYLDGQLVLNNKPIAPITDSELPLRSECFGINYLTSGVGTSGGFCQSIPTKSLRLVSPSNSSGFAYSYAFVDTLFYKKVKYLSGLQRYSSAGGSFTITAPTGQSVRLLKLYTANPVNNLGNAVVSVTRDGSEILNGDLGRVLEGGGNASFTVGTKGNLHPFTTSLDEIKGSSITVSRTDSSSQPIEYSYLFEEK